MPNFKNQNPNQMPFKHFASISIKSYNAYEFVFHLVQVGFLNYRDHPFNTYAKFTEKLKFLTP